MKAPKEFTPDQVLTIYAFASGVSGEDFPRAMRIMREIRGLPRFENDAKTGNLRILPPKEGEPKELYLQLKPSDLPAIWKWVKERVMGNPKAPITTGVLLGLEDTAKALGQEADYAEVVEDLSKEKDDEEEPK